jgi:transposase
MGRPAKYPDAFRRDAVGLVIKSGRPIADVARFARDQRRHAMELGPCGPSGRTAATAPGSVSETEREELKRLRKEVIELQTDKLTPEIVAVVWLIWSLSSKDRKSFNRSLIRSTRSNA